MRGVLFFGLLLLSAPALARTATAQDDLDNPQTLRVTQPGRGPQIPFDEGRWEFWWYFNRDRFIGLRRAQQSLAAQNPDVDEPFRAVTEKDREDSLLPKLVQLLRDSDPQVRVATIQALAKTRDPDARIWLFNGLHDKDHEVRIQAIAALGVWGNTVSLPRLEEVLKDDNRDLQERMFAAVAVGLIGGPLAAESMKHFLNPKSFADAAPMVQAGLAYGVGLTADVENAPLIRALLDDRSVEDHVVRSYLLLSLGKCGEPSDLERLERSLKSSETQHRRSAAIALGVLLDGAGNDAAVAALANAAQGDADLMVKNFAYLSIGRIGGDQASAQLRTDFGRMTRANTPFIALALGILGDPENVPELQNAFESSSDTSYRGAIALALGLHRDGRAAPGLRKAFEDTGEPVLRGHLAVALGLIGDVESIEMLEGAFEGATDVELIPNLATALGLLGSQTAAKAITARVTREKNEFVKQSLLFGLGLVGDRAAIDPLVEAASRNGEVAYVRGYAATALGLIAEPHQVRAISRASQDSNYTIVSNFLNEIFSIL